MAITIGSNISALRTTRQLDRATNNLAAVSERLASGQRINRAADDAAGLAIASTLDATSRLFTKALANVNDGISMLSITDGAAQSLGSILTRIRELATQSANGSYSAVQRRALDEEAQKQRDEYNRILAVTKFNGVKLLDGSQTSIQLQVGTEGRVAPLELMAPNLGATASASSVTFDGSGNYIETGQDTPFDLSSAVTVSAWIRRDGSTGTWQSAVSKSSGSSDGFMLLVDNTVANTVEAWIGSGGRKYQTLSAGWNHCVMVYDNTQSGDDRLKLYVNGTEGGTIASSPGGSAATNNLPLRLGSKSNTPGNYLRGGLDDVRIYSRGLSGSEVATLFSGGVPSAAGLLAHYDFDEGSGTTAGDQSGNGYTGTFAGGGPTWSSDTVAQLAGSGLLTLDTFSLLTASSARAAMDTIENAFANLNTEVGELGSQMSRLQSIVNTIATSRENYLAASGRIKDADIAQETAALTRNQILQQTASEVLAQANQQPGLALQLLNSI